VIRGLFFLSGEKPAAGFAFPALVCYIKNTAPEKQTEGIQA